MSDEHYSSLDEFVGTLQKQGFKREQIREIADLIDASQSSYGSQGLSNKSVFIGSLVVGGIMGGLTYICCIVANEMVRSEPGVMSYFIPAMTSVLSAVGISNANLEARNEEDEKLYQHLKEKFPKIASEVESVAKVRFESVKSALEKRLYTPLAN